MNPAMRKRRAPASLVEDVPEPRSHFTEAEDVMPAMEKVDEPVYNVKSVWSWRRWENVLRFSYFDVEEDAYIVFYCLFYYNKGKELRYRFWLPWRSEKDSKAIYIASPKFQRIIRHFVAESLNEFTRETAK